MFPCHGLFFCRVFGSGVIDPPFIICNMELKTLLSLVIVTCHRYNREFHKTSVVIVCEDFGHQMCKHIHITHLVLNSAVRTNQRIVSSYGDVSQLNAPVLHDMGICTTSTVIRYVLRCLLLSLSCRCGKHCTISKTVSLKLHVICTPLPTDDAFPPVRHPSHINIGSQNAIIYWPFFL